MFGHDDTNPQQSNQGGIGLPQPDGTLTHDAADTPAPAPHPALPPADDDQDQSAPSVNDTSAPTVDEDTDTAGDYIMTDAPQAADPAPAPVSSPAASAPAAAVSSDLLDIKQDALQQLAPLIGHLDQSPEEKFRTTMMMIQASDNQELLKDAYEAAQQITDEKTRAQALLDVVNEINYFTQQGEGDQPEEHEQDSL
jgi:hypothetical protein